MTQDSWDHVKNMLCVRLDALGDVLLTTPALRALKTSSPGRQLTLLTSPAGAAAARLAPEVDAVIVYEAPWMKATAPRPDSQPDLAMLSRLRQARFEAAVIFTVYSQNPLPAALLCYLSDIPLRLAHCRENPYQLLTNWVPEWEPDKGMRHEVCRQLDLVAAVGSYTADDRLSLRPPAGARKRVQALLDELGVDRQAPRAVIHPGASAPSRRYPAESFAEVARRLVQEMGCQVVLSGGPSEQQLVEGIRMAMGAPAVSLAGRLDLGELAALLSLAQVLISNNTGPVHVAAAMGTPVVDLYALTNPQHTPWGVPHCVLYHNVPCKYCYKSICPQGHHDCLRLVTPESVVQATRALLAKPSAPPAEKESL